MGLTPCDRHLFTEKECFVIYDSTKLSDCPLCKALQDIKDLEHDLEVIKVELKDIEDAYDQAKLTIQTLETKHKQLMNTLQGVNDRLEEVSEIRTELEKLRKENLDSLEEAHHISED